MTALPSAESEVTGPGTVPSGKISTLISRTSAGLADGTVVDGSVEDTAAFESQPVSTKASIADMNRAELDRMGPDFMANGRASPLKPQAPIYRYALPAAAAVYASLRSVALSERRRIVGLAD